LRQANGRFPKIQNVFASSGGGAESNVGFGSDRAFKYPCNLSRHARFPSAFNVLKTPDNFKGAASPVLIQPHTIAPLFVTTAFTGGVLPCS
jgi:hypothetical protein